MDQFLDGMASLFGQDADNIIGGRTELPGGGIKRTWADNFWGRSQQELDDAQAKVTTKERGQKYDGTLGLYGLEPVKPGESVASITGRIAQGKKNDQIETTRTTQNLLFNDPNEIERRRVEDQRYYDLQKANLEDRIERRENRATEFEYQKMRDRKEDRLYNERMEKLDRKDRILAMQNIAAGLASLGAAFAM